MTYAIGLNVNEVYTAAQLFTEGKGFGVGDKVTDQSGNEFLFVSAGAAIALGDVVSVSVAHAATLPTTASSPRGRRCAVARAAIANGSFGWVQIYGVVPEISVLASCAADTRLNTTATAGALDDDGTTGAKQIEGIYLSTARGGSAGTAPGFVLHPYISVTI